MAPETRLGQSSNDAIISFLKSESFNNIIRLAVENATKKLEERMEVLQSEVVNLRESNIELIHLITNFPVPSGIKSISKNTEFKTAQIAENVNQMPSRIVKKYSKNIMEQKPAEKKSSDTIEQRAKKQNTPAGENTSRENMSRDGDWETQRSQRRQIRRNKDLIVGKMKNDALFKGVTKYDNYHVFNCEPNLTPEQLKSYLIDDVKIPEVDCQKMDSKHPERYSSFKVSVPNNYTNDLINPEIWPEYVCINKFENRFLRAKASKINDHS